MGWIHKVRICLIVSIAIILIVMAVSFSVLRALLPHATSYIEDIQAELSTKIGLPVKITSINADMRWLTPRLKIIDLVVFRENGKDELIHLKEANFSLAYIDSIRNQAFTIGAIDLVGVELVIERHKNNRWVVQGMEFSGEENRSAIGSSQLIQTLKNINYSLLDIDLRWHDFTNKTESLEFKGVNAKVESFFGTRNFDIRFQLPKQYGKDLQVTAEFDGDIFKPEQLKGEVYINGSSIKLETWVDKFDLGREMKVSGEVDASVWIKFDKYSVKRVAGKIVNSGVEIRRLKHTDGAWSAQQLDFTFLYRKLRDGWRADVNDLVVARGDELWPVKSSLIIKKLADVDTLISSNYLRLKDALPLVKLLADTESNKTFDQLGLDHLSGDLYNLNAKFQDKNDIYTVSSVFEDLAFDLKDQNISIRGIDGEVVVEGDEIKLILDSNLLSIDMADMFRSAIELDIAEGELIIDSSDNGYAIRSQFMSASNKNLKLNTRFEIESTDVADHMDMQVDFFDVNTRYLSRYYPVSELSAELISWLDGAINDGYVEKGSYVFRGDTGDFPFYDSDGVMEVDFRVDDLNLHYLDGWPNLYNLAADIRFYNESLFIENAEGSIQGSDVQQISAAIPDLNKPFLTVGGKTYSDAANLQSFVFNSGLDDILGDALRTIHLKGDAELEFDLDIPLDDEAEVKTNGKLTFLGAQLDYPTMDYLLTGINGSLSFTEENMSAQNIHALFDGNKVEIDVVPVETPEIRESVFYIKGDIGIKPLLKTFDWIPSGWLEGRSDWEVGIHVPYTEEEYQVRVSADSDMGDVSLNISDGLQKKSGSKLPVDIEVFVFEESLKIDAVSKDRFTINAERDYKNIWAVDVSSNLISGKAIFEQGMSTDSTVFMNLDSVTLHAFATRKAGSGINTLLPSNIPSLELRAKQLYWDDWVFSNSMLFSDWHPQGMVVKELKIEGPSLLIDAQGSWLYSWQHKHESNFKINASSQNLGIALKKMEIFKDLERTKLNSTSDWQWQGAPYSFSWAKAKGSSEVQLSDGEMQEVDPGAGGRLLGLFNVLQLPKRVALDFDDVYKEGFVFDDVTADFKLKDGNATSSRIDINAAAAKIRMFGRIGMHDRDYDLEVLVKPHSSAATFTGGTLAGGPVFGASLVLIQKLLGLDKATYDQYAITGQWNDPIVTQISKRKAETK